MRIIRETTEFGLDMLRGLPVAYWHALHDQPHRCVVKPGLKSLYKLITPFVEESDNFHPINPPDIYKFERPKWTNEHWTPPPLQKIFQEKLHNINYTLPTFTKPTVVINNKFSACWDENNTRRVSNELNVSTSMDEILTLPIDLKSHTVSRFLTKDLKKIILYENEDFMVIDKPAGIAVCCK